MNIKKETTGEKTVFHLSGRLDTMTAPDLEAELLPEIDSAAEVLLDLSDLIYVSSSGLRVLILGEKTAKSKGSNMLLANVSPDVMDILEMTGLNSVLKII